VPRPRLRPQGTRLRADALRDEHRHSPQRRLLFGESCKGVARLRIGDRSCDELSELCEPELHVGRLRLDFSRGGEDDAPESAPDLTGDATADRTPRTLAICATAPLASFQSSSQAASPMRNT
jgi:hypothetical protein